MRIQTLQQKIQLLRGNSKGFTIIEALVVLFIFVLVVITFYSIFSKGSIYIIESKNRLGALAVANEKMEIVRNLKYDDVGTEGGAVEGNIPEDEDITANGKQFHVHTVVGQIDDPYDDVYPTDTIPGDYKKVTITVSWENIGIGNSEVTLESRFVPPGLEVLNAGDGILSINIFSDQPGGEGIPNSTVHIRNTETGLDTTQETDASGNIILVGEHIQDSIQKYEIIVTKSGFESVSTLPPYPTTPDYSPVDVHASVVTGSVNVANIVQNELADLVVSTVDYLDNPLAGIDFELVGGRKIGYAVEIQDGIPTVTSNPVYNLTASETTDASGEKNFNAVSPGQYTFSLAASETGYELISTDPTSPFSLFSEPPLTFKAKLANKSFTSILVKVEYFDGETSSLVSDAEVRLSNQSGYDVTQTSGSEGTVYFPTTADLFQSGTYDLTVTAEGFAEYSSQVSLSENELLVETVTLTVL